MTYLCVMILTIGLFKLQTQTQIMGFSRKLNIFLILFIYVIILITAYSTDTKSTDTDDYSYDEIAWSPLPKSPLSIDLSINNNYFQKPYTTFPSAFYHLLPTDETFDELSNNSD